MTLPPKNTNKALSWFSPIHNTYGCPHCLGHWPHHPGLEEVVIIHMLCLRAHTVLMAYDLDVWIYLAHSCSSCIRLRLLGSGRGNRTVIHIITQLVQTYPGT